jgi:hypothetical protein
MNYKIETTDTITPALRKMQNQKALAKTFKSATAKAGRLGVQ